MTNTIEVSRQLQKLGDFTEKQANAIAESQAKLVEGSAATKADLKELEIKVEGKFATQDMKINLVLALLLIVLARVFFK